MTLQKLIEEKGITITIEDGNLAALLPNGQELAAVEKIELSQCFDEDKWCVATIKLMVNLK